MSCPSFIVQSFAVRTAAHLLHLSATSYAQHVALNEFYDALLPLVDRFAEVYIGLESQPKSWPTPATVARDPVTLLEDYLDLLEQEAGDTESEALKNILAELEELTAQSVYKMRFLK